LAELRIPLHTISHTPRVTLPSHIVELVSRFGCTSLYANIEYEVDELRRDIQICELAESKRMAVTFVHNKCIVDPGIVLTKEKKSYAVRSFIVLVRELRLTWILRFTRRINVTG
jgi:deoxyribodipyrimidine photo-lyase